LTLVVGMGMIDKQGIFNISENEEEVGQGTRRFI
jgi:hypothetical protein